MVLRIPFDSSPQVSSGLALLFVISLSAVVGWLAVHMSMDILQYAQEIPSSVDARLAPYVP